MPSNTPQFFLFFEKKIVIIKDEKKQKWNFE